jgi:transposase
MAKRTYRSISIKQAMAQLQTTDFGDRVVLAIDVAKQLLYGALIDAATRQTLVIIKWEHPQQTRELLALVDMLREREVGIEAVMEPSGTYGDVVRHQLGLVGVELFSVAPKRVYDAQALYDGVRSLHDPKAAVVIGRLHLDGLSTRWQAMDNERRELVAHAAAHSYAVEQAQHALGRIEALLARCFPEVGSVLSLADATLPALLAHYGSPHAMAADPEGVDALLRRKSRGKLDESKRAKVYELAQQTLGVPMLPAETALMQTLAEQVLHARRLKQRHDQSINRQVAAHPACSMMRPVVGAGTAAVIVADVGDPRMFSCARAYLRAFGLNLREHSSGRRQGRLSITKCGPARARKFLWLASMALIRRDPIIAAYYRAKLERDGGRHKLLATTAVMRKVALALFHVGRGAAFEPERLVDVSRLQLPETYRDELNRRRVRFVA